ncbi:inactive polyglycylase TTLL10 isoform X2 [Panthera pardus]|uniref:Tubulin--tyrosine ligase-like protein 10 n=1 Tax=Panthera pardus TaxID=9691 RepID=A0A9W2V942_PANPR|nr:inactive polyglycylase TTLL10 isoform X2 [Panthera pardus]XP_053755098.1 inactive polyglycylase TTLL10 isoform X2 [Panthera pardus]XP_053755099.1 inactive polyglycylase TTLL10 isoform X2 [Panthera pardus]
MLPGTSLPSPTSDTRATLSSKGAPAWGQGAPPDPRRPDSRHHRGQARQCQTHGPCRESLAWNKQDAEMTLPPQGTRPHGHRRDRSQPQAEAQVQDPGRHPSLRLGPRTAQRSHRGVGVVSSQSCPRPCAPTPAARSHTRFIYHRGPPTRTHVSRKRGKWSRIAGVRRSHTRVPGWAHKRPMGSSQEEQPLHRPSQSGQDADLLDAADTARPQASLLERHLPEGERQLHGSGQGPYFYIGGTNGASIISSYCKGKGWQRIEDSRREDYKLKWCEVKCRDSYYSFREGEQLLYQLPNNKLLTTKIGLLSALREYSRVVSRTHKTSPCAQAKSRKDTTSALEELTWTSPGCFGPQRVLKMEEFFPETYRLDIRDEREAFFTLFDENQTWICKPTASNQGKGIFLLRNQEEVAALQVKTQSIEDDPIYRKMPFRAPQARVVQRYIQNPLLLDGKKFDVRSYLLIACATPYMVFFGHGYARLTLSLYDPHSSDLSGHLTNQFMQKKSPLYMLLKEDTVWSMDHLNRYINDKFRKTKGLPRDWVFTTFTKRMQQIMAHCFQAVKSKLQCKLGYFDLIGCDFLIDENFKVWLLEMNSNPALHTNCEVLKEVIPGVVTETLDLALETFQKSLRGQKMLPLLSQRHFVLLHDGEADLWPRPGGSRGALRPPPPLRAAPRPGARTPAPPRGPGGAHARPRPPGRGPDGSTQSREPGAERPREGAGGPAREPSPGLAEEERKNAGHRGS